MKPTSILARAAALALVLGATAAPAAAQTEKVRILLDWGWLPYHASFFLAQERGYFKDAGVEAEIEQGRGSNTTAILVGQRSFDMGHLNITNAAAAIAKGVPLKVVAVYQHRTSASFVGIEGRVKLDGPDSLKGLRIGSTPGGSDGLSLSIFRRSNKIPDNALNVISLDASSKTAGLLTNQVDVVSGDSHAYQAIVRGAGHKPVVLELASYGVPLLGFGFATNETFLKEKPQAIKGVLAAAKRGFADAVADPEGACTLIRSKVQVAGNLAQCIDYMTGLQKLSQSPTDPNWGRSTDAEWEALVSTLRDVGEIKGNKPANTYYTNELVP
ncbi:ABC transporter substrate-binding protein [Allostella vacuolata]|nr:ABC transporter substrate-binding protein [Stella vacuolata]